MDEAVYGFFSLEGLGREPAPSKRTVGYDADLGKIGLWQVWDEIPSPHPQACAPDALVEGYVKAYDGNGRPRRGAGTP